MSSLRGREQKVADALPERRFVADVLRNGKVRAILSRWDTLGLPGGWLVAGCLFQTVWNLKSGRDPEADIKDYDLFYFDAADLGAGAEQLVQARVAAALSDLAITVEVKNQARVHLWYESYFGYPYPALKDAREGVDRFLVPATCVAIRPANAGYEVYAPHGLSALYDGILAPNPLTDHPPLFRDKAESYRRRWPWLRITRSTAPAAPPLSPGPPGAADGAGSPGSGCSRPA